MKLLIKIRNPFSLVIAQFNTEQINRVGEAVSNNIYSFK